MNVKKMLVILAAAAMVAAISGCASTNKLAQLSAAEDLSESTSFKGMSTKDVTKKLGKPQQKKTTSKGNQIWEYKKSADQHSALNGFIRVSSLGLYGEEDAIYVDVLKLTFAGGVVISQEYSENVMNISLPGMSSSKDDD